MVCTSTSHCIGRLLDGPLLVLQTNNNKPKTEHMVVHYSGQQPPTLPMGPLGGLSAEILRYSLYLKERRSCIHSCLKLSHAYSSSSSSKSTYVSSPATCCFS